MKLAMKSNILVLAILVSLTVLGGFLRIYNIDKNPPSLTGDEISFGYIAYSLLKTGRDEHGKFLPLVFESIGDFKNPIPAYFMILPISLLGLNDFSVRLPNALLGTLTIPMFFWFLFYVLRNKYLALLGAFLLSISAWHISYSRYAYEPLMASLFALIGIWFFMKIFDLDRSSPSFKRLSTKPEGLQENFIDILKPRKLKLVAIKIFEGGRIWAFLSAFFLILTMYTAFAPRLFIPLFVISVLIFKIRSLKANWDKIVIFVLTSIFLALPLLYASVFLGAGTRFSMVFIGNDIEFSRYIKLGPFNGLTDLPLLLFFWAKRYLNYLQPDFLFLNGLNMTLPGNIGLGLFYLFELPWLILGTIYFFTKKIPYKSIFVIWLLVGIVPDSITNNQQHSGRLLHIFPVLYLILTLGAVVFFKRIFNIKKAYLKFLIISVYLLVTILIFTHAYLVFTVHFPRHKGESFDEGLREAVFYIRDNQHKYSEVIFDPRRGIEGPYLVSNPQLYVQFYLQYDPYAYQTKPKVLGTDPKNPYLSFDKYTFRHINWTVDKNKKGALFIGSPWNIPSKDLKEGELLEIIYMSNEHPTFYITSPK